ncbi:MerR family transcriptional regulator [Alkalibacterium sp. 20]|uniref:MerR family transcriptional regulator n=1 Tax=Alkalibacterium sp. 20 TaxID=1798803 RepID=UPI0009002FE9|nr:MerR family transcriptional regulator [Alkalibacterium sp. 20]OJF93751.1 MerR family transcriptional regulator [Alkalibacterium sp. 20]
MVGIELDMVVPDSLAALELYEQIFELERLEVTEFDRGQNEVIFKLYDLKIHMLDENTEIGLKAPSDNSYLPMWLNVTVPNIAETFSQALDAGCTAIQPITEIPDFGVSNALFVDPYGYQWLLHQVHKEVSFEERNALWEEKLKED